MLIILIEKLWINFCRRGEGEEGKMGKEVGMRKSKLREGRGCGFKKRKRKECYEGK